LVWGVIPVLRSANIHPGEDRLETAIRAAFIHGALPAGAVAVVLAGHPLEGGERLPTLRVVRVGVDGRSCSPA
jgi:pyruvate kinase